MTAIDRLEVKLSAMHHVRDAAYWKLPVGTPIVAHPKAKDLSAAGLGSKVKVGPGGGATKTYEKTGTDSWSGGYPGEPRSFTSQQLGVRIGDERAELAIKGGQAKVGAFNRPSDAAAQENARRLVARLGLGSGASSPLRTTPTGRIYGQSDRVHPSRLPLGVLAGLRSGKGG